MGSQEILEQALRLKPDERFTLIEVLLRNRISNLMPFGRMRRKKDSRPIGKDVWKRYRWRIYLGMQHEGIVLEIRPARIIGCRATTSLRTQG